MQCVFHIASASIDWQKKSVGFVLKGKCLKIKKKIRKIREREGTMPFFILLTH